jgi:hypothetical protein
MLRAARLASVPHEAGPGQGGREGGGGGGGPRCGGEGGAGGGAGGDGDSGSDAHGQEGGSLRHGGAEVCGGGAVGELVAAGGVQMLLRVLRLYGRAYLQVRALPLQRCLQR